MTILPPGGHRLVCAGPVQGQADERLGQQGDIWRSSPDRFNLYSLVHDAYPPGKYLMKSASIRPAMKVLRLLFEGHLL
jgi:hypothetical protein